MIYDKFDIKIVLVNNAVVDLMEEIMLDGNRLEIKDNRFNTLIFYNMSFSTGYEPTLPNVDLNNNNYLKNYNKKILK